MAKVVPDYFIDNGIAADVNLNGVRVCAGQPSSFADIASRTLASGSAGSVTVGAGTPDGRQSNLPGVADMTITASGTADHIVYVNTGASLYYVTTCTPTALVANGSNKVSTAAGSRRVGAAA